MKKIFVYPAPGVEVRNPRSKELLPESGAWVPYDGYWLRRLKDGDVSREEPDKKPPTFEETLRAMKVQELKDYALEKNIDLKSSKKDDIVAELLEAAQDKGGEAQ